MKAQGNGSSQYPIHLDDLGGWVRVFTDRAGALPDNFAFVLSQLLTEWFRQRPHLRMRCVIPITKDGTTVELHAWYEAHLFPAPPPPEPS